MEIEHANNLNYALEYQLWVTTMGEVVSLRLFGGYKVLRGIM